MSNTVRTFRAATADEALAQVRREMGLDAVIVEVKQISKTGILSWLSTKSLVEVKAQRPTAVRARSIAETANDAATFDKLTVAAAAAKMVSIAETATQQSVSAGSFDWTPSPSVTIPPALEFEELAPPPSLLPPVPTPAKFVSIAEQRRLGIGADQRSNSRPASSTPARSVPVSDLDVSSPTSIEKRLDALQQMITDLSRRSTCGLVEIPPCYILF